MAICALYRTEEELRESHLIPKFVIAYMKKTGSKYLRGYQNVNIRMQDGYKMKLLSHRAEQEFGTREQWFAENIFKPFQSGIKTEFDYDHNLAYFAISLLWRAVVAVRSTDKAIMGNPAYDFLDDVAEEWRMFLTEFKYPMQYNDLNIFLTDRVREHDIDAEKVDMYMTRVSELAIPRNDSITNVYVYVKFLKFVFWAKVKGNIPESSETKISFYKGKISSPQQLNDPGISSYFYNRIKQLDPIRASPEQEEKIHQEFMRNAEEFMKTDAGQSMYNDFVLREKYNQNTEDE